LINASAGLTGMQGGLSGRDTVGKTNISSLESNMTVDNYTLAVGAMAQVYYNFTNFTLVNISTKNPIANFLPYHCIKHANGGPESPIIAYSGSDEYTAPIVRDLKILI
jgi:hypothetical protein